MARLLSQSLIAKPLSIRSSPRFLNLRGRSNSSDNPAQAQLVEIDLGESDTGSGPGGEPDFIGGMRRLEDAIHGIIVKRAAPDWLPFVPGSSYWVPPRRKGYGYSVVELAGRIRNPVSEEEALSMTTVRGWPSSSYFIEGSPPPPVEEILQKTVKSEDEEA